MTKTMKGSPKGDVDACLSEWTSREMQLVRLHEEILSNREAILNCSLAYSQSQLNRTLSDAPSLDHALVRNHKLLQDIRYAQEDAQMSLNMSPTPRFMTLQKNYWSMVKSQVPMWEQDIGITRPSTARSTARDSGARSKTPRTPRTPVVSQTPRTPKTPGTQTPRTPNEDSIASQIIGTKSPTGIQPKKLQTKKQHDARLKASLQNK